VVRLVPADGPHCALRAEPMVRRSLLRFGRSRGPVLLAFNGSLRIDHNCTALLAESGGTLPATEEPATQQGHPPPLADVAPASLHRPDLGRFPRQPDVPGISGNSLCKATQPSAISSPQNRQSMAGKHHMPVPTVVVGSSARTTGARSAVLYEAVCTPWSGRGLVADGADGEASARSPWR
jgi:hypothetical protein